MIAISKKRFLLIFAGFMIISFIGLAAGKEPYKIGAFLSITGPNAPLGTPERDTLIMLEEKINKAGGINGHPLQLIIEDDASDPTTAVKAVKKLIDQDKVSAIIGSSGTGPTMAAISSMTENAGIPHISCAAGLAITNPIRRWVFRTPQTDTMAVAKILDYLKKRKLTKIAMIYDSNAYGVSGRDQLRALASHSGVTVVDEESFGSKDTDMTVQLTKIRGTNAQAVVCWGTNPGPAQVTKNLRQLGINLPLIQSHGVANQSYIDLSQGMAEGVVLPAGKLIVAHALPVSDPQRKILLQYQKDFQAQYGKSADTFGGFAWDALMILVTAMKKVGNDPVKVQAAVEKTRNFRGISGVFNYSATDHDGLTKDAFVMVTIKNGNWVLTK